MLKVIVTNPAEVASQRSLLANVAAAIAPDYIRQRVDEGIAQRLSAQLAREGVRALIIIEPNPPNLPQAAPPPVSPA